MRKFDAQLRFLDVMHLRESNQIEKRIIVSSNVVLFPFLEKYFLYYDDSVAVIFQGIEETIQKGNQADAIFVLVDLKERFPEIYYHVYEMDDSNLEKAINLIILFWKECLSKMIYITSRVAIWLCEMDMGENLPLGQHGFNDIVKRVNEFLVEFSADNNNVSVINSNKILRSVGSDNAYDIKRRYLFLMPYTQCMYNHMAYEVLISLKQQVCKKCLVLDCDNVLWKGIIRDDGIEGINVGQAYRDFQREIIKLYCQGIIICLCSKNELSDVLKIVNYHPDFLLRDKYITAYRVCEYNKPDAVRDLVKELNITFDSVVFMDDSAYEIGLINSELPEVTAIHLNAEKPEGFANVLRNAEYFNKKSISATDKFRTFEYKQIVKREIAIHSKSIDLENYLRRLNQKMIIEEINEFSFYRVVELSQRTNQFNLSNVHLDNNELKRFLEKSGNRVYTLRLIDIYGDMGIVAAAMVSINDNDVVIESMFLSCRAFDRGCEQELIKYIKNDIRRIGIDSIKGCYRDNGKNRRFKNFYEEQSIELYVIDKGGNHINLNNKKLDIPVR